MHEEQQTPRQPSQGELNGAPACVYRLLPRADWQAAVTAGEFTGSEHDRRDGFIHLSTAEQVDVTADLYYRKVPDLMLLCLQTSRLGDLRMEPSTSGALYPHLYGGGIPLAAVLEAMPLSMDAQGRQNIPLLSPLTSYFF